MATWKLFYDGGCNLCHVSKLRAEKWAKKAGQPMDVDVLLGDEAISKGYGEAMVLEADGQVLTAADAWLKILTIGPWYLRWLPWMRLTKPTMFLARMGYRIVDRYRYRWFGTRECQIHARPTPQP